MICKTSLAALGAMLVTTVCLSVWAASGPQPHDEPSRAYLHGFNLPSSGVALEGYCPVAYFAVDRPVRGKPEHASKKK